VTAGRVIWWTTALAVVGVAAVAAVASYEHAYALVRMHGEAGWTGRMVPLMVDGLIYASSMVMLDAARRRMPVPVLARWLLGLGIAATLAANVAHGLGQGPVGAAVAAWPAIALVGSYELLMMVIRVSQVVQDGVPGKVGSPGSASGAGSRGIRRSTVSGFACLGSCNPCAAPRRPGPCAAVAGLPRCGSKASGKPRSVNKLTRKWASR
jgi:hypothetical protein